MQQLNLPAYDFRIKTVELKNYIYDPIRRRYVMLTPEEWVRQNFMQYLINVKNYPEALMAVEKQLIINTRQFRFDLVSYQRSGKPLLIAEFKAPGVKITQDAFDQVVRYNMFLKVELVVVSNGLQHYVCEIDYANNTYNFLKDVPEYNP